MQYRLRTLLILLAVGPPMLARAWVVGEPVVWRYMWPPPTGLATDQTVWIDGRRDRVEGRACQQPNGIWAIID